MEYTLDSYANFDTEQSLLHYEARKKEELEKRLKIEQNEREFRFKCISGNFLRYSWDHKKQFILSMVKNIDHLDTILRIINYISILCGKTASYIEVSPHCQLLSQQIFVDHDRALEYDTIKETVCEDLNWLSTVSKERQIVMIVELLQIAGRGLLRKIYIPIVHIYNRKVVEQLKAHSLSQGALGDIFNKPEPDDLDKYPYDHPHSIEVEKIRKKWDETIEKYRREIYGVEKKASIKIKEGKPEKKSKDKEEKVDKKTTKKGAKNNDKKSADTADWIQRLPIWIVKKILDHFDQKTLQNLKKVNPYWSYACDSLLKDRQARVFLNEAITKMVSNVNPQILKEFRESGTFFDKKQDSPREKRLKKLMSRGAVLESMRPNVSKSLQVRAGLITSIPQSADIYDPIDKTVTFPRLIRPDLLLYKTYPCILKDLNILIDVEESLKERIDEALYSLSQQLSDAFSMSEANLADW